MDLKDQQAIASHHDVFESGPSIDPELERKIRRKLDWRLMPILTLVYLFAFIDRSNAGNARVLGMGQELKLDGYRFNIGLSGFFVTYIALEVPANIVCKMVGPKIWIPLLTVCFGLTTTCMSTMQGYNSFLAARICLGVFEAGIMPGITYTLSCFYRRHELVTRVGLYASVASLSGAFGGLLATAFSKIPPWGIIHTWRNIFFFEGLISIMLGVTAYFVLPKSPEEATFLTPEEREIASYRITKDLKSHHIETLKMKYVKRAFFNVNTILVALASFCSLLTMNSMALFVPSILNAMGHSGIQSQLLSVPPYALAATVCICVSLASDRTRRRGAWVMGVMPFTALGFILLIVPLSPGVHYFALFMCLIGSFTASPMFVAWSVDNSAGHMTRAIVAGAVVGFGNIGGLVAAWTYILADAPRYIKGHSLNLSFACLCFIIVGITVAYLHRENKLRRAGARDGRLQSLTEEEIRDLGHEHPEFYFTL